MGIIKQTKEEKIREEAIDVSRALFKRYGYQKTTMEDIARAMGRGKSTLYYYYKSKDEIFESIVLREAKDLFSTIALKVENASTGEEKLKIYVLTAYQVINEKAVLGDVILNEMLQVNGAIIAQPSMLVHLGEFNKRWLSILRDLLTFGVDNNEFSKSVLDDIESISFVLMGTLVSTVVTLSHFGESKHNDSLMSVPEVLVSLVNILINGLKYRP